MRDTERAVLRIKAEQHALLHHCLLPLLVILSTVLLPQRELSAESLNQNRIWGDSATELKDTSWQIIADKITRYTDPDRIIAEGNVLLHPREEKGGEPTVLQADWINYTRSEGRVEARGNIVLKRAKRNLTAEKATIDLDSQEASFTEATLFIPKYQLHFTSRQINKTSEDIYHFQDGYYTTCSIEEGKKPPWQLKTGEGTLDLNGLGLLRDTVLRVKGFPVFYVPYLPIPLSRERETGFLLPELSSSSRSGVGIAAPYFINLSPSSDLTFFPGYLSRRGPSAGLEFRYFAGYESKVFLGASYLNDQTEDTPADDYKSDGFLRQKENRYWIWGKGDYDFGDRLITRIDLDIVSDRDYLQEFENSVARFDELDSKMFDQTGRGFGEPSLPYRLSRFNLNKSWDSAFLGGQIIGIDDSDYPPAAANQINSLPHLIYAGFNRLTNFPFDLTWNTDYVNYWREEGIGEERLDLHPRLISSLPLPPSLEGMVSAGYRETIYSINSYGNSDWKFEETQFRSSWDVKSELGTTLVRDFGTTMGSWEHISHSFRPEASYHYRWVNNDDPLPALDIVDTLPDINRLTYSLNNYFRARGRDGNGKPFEKYLGYVKLSQYYDLQEARRDLTTPWDERRPFSDIALRMDIYPLPRWELKFRSRYSVYGEGVTNYDLFTKYSTTRGDNFSIDYRYERDAAIHEINAEVETKLTNTLIFQGDIKQSLENDETVSSSLNLIYHPQCWALKFSVENTPEDERIAIVLSLVGLGDSLGIGFTEDLAEGGGIETTLEGNVLDISDSMRSNEE